MRNRLPLSPTGKELRAGTLALVVASATALGCDDKKTETDPAGTSASASAGVTASASSPAPAASTAQPEEEALQPLELQELTFTSEVKNKEPVDVLLAAEPGERVWAHLRLRNRNEETRKIHLEFQVNGDKRTTLDLKVTKSWSYRTWAYNTLLESDKKGTVSLTVTDDEGTVLAETSLPIAQKARTKPYVKSAK